MKEIQPSVQGGRKFLYRMGFFLVFVAFVGGGFLFFSTKRYQSQIAKQTAIIQAIDADIVVAQEDPQYVKYAAAKEIMRTQQDSAGWGDRLSRIIHVFAQLQQLGGANVRFTDFGIDFSSLRLKGTVSTLKLMYGKSGIIDQFNALGFLENITISDYKKTEDGYTFTLVADVVLHHVGK